MAIECKIHHDYNTHSLVVIAHDGERCYTSAYGDIVRKDIKEGQLFTPLLKIDFRDRALLQELANALGEHGILPKTGDNAKELTATKAHLEDMRRMTNKAFDLLVKKANQ